MSGYRQSSYDPEAYEQPGRPLRPYNWVQWTGVALGTVGIAIALLHLLGRIGWMPQWVDDPAPASFVLPLIGVLLINSRREPSSLVTAEQLARNRRMLVITLIVVGALLAVAALIDLSGA